MSSSNAWAEFAAVFRQTRTAFLQHENAKVELKSLMPEDAKGQSGMASAPSAQNPEPSASICSNRRLAMQCSSELDLRLASVRKAPVDLTSENCMASLRFEQIEADGSGF